MKQPHKHAALIKAWADGAEIEVYDGLDGWQQTEFPTWNLGLEYRIKPEPKPDVAKWYICKKEYANIYGAMYDTEEANLRLTFDGETGALKKAEVIK